MNLLPVSLSCKTCLEKLIFWSGPLNLETGKKRKKNIECLKNEMCISEEIKTVFHNF